MKNPLIVANWKMNPAGAKAAVDLAAGVAQLVYNAKAEVALCPPYVYLPQVYALSLKGIALGAQDVFWQQGGGAYTGEISARMLKNTGCSYVIIGHSERKQYLGETPEMMNKKMQAALAAGLRPILCIGEKEKASSQKNSEVERQMKRAIMGIKKPDVSKLVLAYEPEWAISTNKNAEPATPARAAETIEFMRNVLKKMLGREVSKKVRILYGGSVDKRNIASFLQEGKVDGALVGSASLKQKEFVALVRNAELK